MPDSPAPQPAGARLVILAKAPRPGFAKTRLAPVLGRAGAADLARRLLIHAIAAAREAQAGPIELCVTPAPSDPAWRMAALPEPLTHGIHWSRQGGGHLGDRLARVARRVAKNGESVILVGTDCPGLGAAELSWARTGLQSADATLIPTADGGYALLGLRRFHPSLFADIAWSTASVAHDTMARLDRLGWSVARHPPLHDIDVPADLVHLPDGWPEARLAGRA